MGQSILLVEDDPRLAAAITDILTQANYAVDGPHKTLSDGMEALARRMPSGAVLDTRFQHGGAEILADDLENYDIPFVFCGTSHGEAAVHPDAPILASSTLYHRLVPALREILP